jgi:hypothetical protein
MKLVGCLLLALVAPVRADFITGPDVFVEDRVVPDRHDDGSERYLTLGVLSAPSGGWFGVRAQLDLWSIGGFSIGGAGTLFARGDVPIVTDATLKGSGVGYLAYTTPLLAWNLRMRAQLGWGGAFQVGEDTTTKMAVTTRATIVEGALFLTARGNHDWSFTGGPIVQQSDAGDTSAMVFLGLQRRF